jgi:hypothetical protein
MLYNYDIYIEKWIFDQATELKEISMFSTIANKTLDSTLDLKEYSIEVGNIEYSFERSDNSSKNELYFETSDISFKLSGIRNREFLKDWFGIYVDTRYIKYLLYIKVSSTGDLVYRGIVNQESLEQNFNTSGTSKRISIQGLGFEKEFKNYYSNKPLLSISDIPYWYSLDNILGHFTFNNNTYYYKAISLRYLLQKLFENNFSSIQLEDQTWEKYQVVNYPYLGKPSTINNGYLHLKTGYDSFHNTGMSCYKFLECICNARGWVMFFNKDKLCIKNRSTENLILTDFDGNLLKSDYSILKTIPQLTFDNIVIFNGSIFGGDDSGCGTDMRGVRHQIITSTVCSRNTNPFNGIWQSSNKLWFGKGYKWQRAVGENTDSNGNILDNSWRYQIYEWLQDNGAFGRQNVWIDKEHTLFLDAGDPGVYKWGYSTSDGHQFPHLSGDDNDIQDDEVIYNGNAGSCIFSVEDNTFKTDDDYYNSKTFENNFQKYFSNSIAINLKGKIKGELIDPLVLFNLINKPELSGLWSVNSFSVSLQKTETEINWQKKL